MSTACDLRRVVAEADCEIAHYESILVKIREKRRNAQLQLDSIVFPISSLPPEITSEIFILCLPTSSLDRQWNSVNAHEAPMVLSHVCRTWRAIAISTPTLWAQIDLEMHDDHSLDVFKTWVGRSRAHPLSLKFHGWTGKDAPAVFETFACCSEWNPWNFPLLQKLSLSHSWKEWWEEGATIETFVNTPFLRVVSLGAVSPSSLALPWQQLTAFTGTGLTIPECLEVLKLSPNLVECAFAASDEMETCPLVTHSNLQSLTLFRRSVSNDDDYRDAVSSTIVLRLLTLSALQTLRILDCVYDDFEEVDFSAFLERS
ncbi:hypothetical protein DFH07DRAFT_791220 [Mycena maculata]|uniref:F-box domain-containing protein n=1 Tax=Mycena maculata TaxID=230809 RepID=A0AAD7KB03_9AGAR|nr:hypothetical protein DFH07DRAFT_791220 [Mycena maculata]